MATLLKHTGEAIEVFPANPAEGFTLEECYKLLTFDDEMPVTIIQAVPITKDRTMILDEEGKFKHGFRARFNKVGSALLAEAGGAPLDWVTSHALICNETEFQ